MADFQYRKRVTTGNLTKRQGPPRDKGGSTAGPVRFPTLPAHLRNRPRGEGETTISRLRRLVRDTPGCQVCGAREGLTYRRVRGMDRFRCPDHLNASLTSGEAVELIAQAEYESVKSMTRYYI